jgi:GNAT superfamily N-acetyltransferase
LEIIKACADHARAIAEVHVQSWRQAYSGLLPTEYLDALSIGQREGQWLEVLLCEDSTVLVAEERGEIKGFLRMGRCRDLGEGDDMAEIMALYVDPSSWRQGIGRALMRQCFISLHGQGYCAASLWVIAGNVTGSRFFEEMGFEQEDGRVEPFELAGVSLLEQRYRCQL